MNSGTLQLGAERCPTGLWIFEIRQDVAKFANVKTTRPRHRALLLGDSKLFEKEVYLSIRKRGSVRLTLWFNSTHILEFVEIAIE